MAKVMELANFEDNVVYVDFQAWGFIWLLIRMNFCIRMTYEKM